MEARVCSLPVPRNLVILARVGQDGVPGVHLHSRAATDHGGLRVSRVSHVCTEEPIAEEEELPPAVRSRCCLSYAMQFGTRDDILVPGMTFW